MRPLPDPTPARPGSAEKIAELAKRVELGLQLWHPEDASQPLWHFSLVVRFRSPRFDVVREARRRAEM